MLTIDQIKSFMTPGYLTNERQSFLITMQENYKNDLLLCSKVPCEDCFLKCYELREKNIIGDESIFDYTCEIIQAIKEILG